MLAKDDRVAAMLLGRRAIRVVPLPGFEPVEGEELPTVGVRILLESELDETRIDAVQYVDLIAKKHRLDARSMLEMDAEILDREVMRATVLRAFVEPLDGNEKPGAEPKRFFESLARVRTLDSVILRAFFEVYLEHHDYVSPYRNLDEAGVKELADALSKGPNAAVSLALYDAATLRRLALSMAALLVT